PTLHRENGLKCEADRERVKKEEMEEAHRKYAQSREGKEHYESEYPTPAGPPRPPVIGPIRDPKEEKRRMKEEARKKAEARTGRS
ncbi:MAG: hypothetical protein SGPRY_014881, partial [Prymnesium sp.]